MTWYRRFVRFLSDSVLPWTGALALHALVLVALIFSLGWRHQAAPAVAAGGPKVEAIEAVVVDSAMLDQQVRKLAALERAQARQLALERQQAQEAQAARERQLQVQREAAEQAQREEQARLQQLQREAEEAQARAAAEAKAREEARRAAEAQAEARRLAQLEAERKAAEEAKRRAEQERRQREEEAKRREQERLAQEQQREAEQLLLAALAEEESRQAKVDAGLLAQYKAQVKQKVERNWARPPEAQAGLTCEVNVRQLRDGQVISVEFGACNGNDAVKRSIEGAVNRASPLPPPPDPSLFDEYLVFIFEPE